MYSKASMILLTAFILDFAAFSRIKSAVFCSSPYHSDTDLQNYFNLVDAVSQHYLKVAVDPCETIDQFKPQTLVWSINITSLWIQQNRYLTFLTPEKLSEKSRLMPLRLDSNLYSYSSDSENTVNIMEWYKVEGKLFAKELTVWSSEKGFYGTNQNLWSVSRRGNLQGISLKTVIIPQSTDAQIDKNGELVGTMVEATEMFSDALNFTIIWKIRKDGEWGFFQNNTWSGIVGDLAYKKASFSSTALWYYPERTKVIEYGLGLFDDSITIGLSPHYGKISKSKLNARAFINVFKSHAWMLLGLITFSTGLVYSLLGRMDVNSNKNNWHWHFFDGVIEYSAILMQRTLIILPNHQPKFQRFLFGLQLSSMFVYFAYASGLTALVTSKETVMKPRSFQDMINMGIRVIFPYYVFICIVVH